VLGSDRRHQILYRRLPDLGTLIAAVAPGTPVFGMMHQPFIGERFSGDSARPLPGYHRASGKLRCGVAILKEATAFTTSPLLIERRRPRGLSARRGSGAADRYAATAIPTACSPPAISISWSKPN